MRRTALESWAWLSIAPSWPCGNLGLFNPLCAWVPHLRNGDAETHPLIMRKKGADTYMQRILDLPGWQACSFSTPNSGALRSWGPCTGGCRVKLRGPVTNQYRQEADSASWRLPSMTQSSVSWNKMGWVQRKC